jgi:transitional endoplasmic reticulum ATPase
MTQKYTVTVPDEQAEWLDDQPHRDPSGLLQQAIREQRRKETSQRNRQRQSQRSKRETDRPHDHDVMNEDAVAVERNYPNDAGRGIARINPDTMKAITAAPGDIIEIEGRTTMAAKAWRADRQDWNTQIIRIDEFTRQNADIDIGEYVTIQTIEPTPADRVVLTPPDETNGLFESTATDMIWRQIAKRPGGEGDIVPVMPSTNHPFMRSPGQTMPFIAVETAPNGVVVVSDETTIELQTE